MKVDILNIVIYRQCAEKFWGSLKYLPPVMSLMQHIFATVSKRGEIWHVLIEAGWHICVSKLTIIDSDNGLLPAPSHYLNQCWNIVNWTIGNKLQWNINQNSNIFIQENAFENDVWKMAAIFAWPQCVNTQFCASLWDLLMRQLTF